MLKTSQNIALITLKVQYDQPRVIQQLHQQLGEGHQPYPCLEHSGSLLEMNYQI